MSKLTLGTHPFLLGFDQLERLVERTAKSENGYPPYNIERTGEDAYRISMAVAGFSEDDLDIEAKENTLLVKGSQTKDEDSEGEMLFRGIAARNFERRFQLADHVEVRSANLKNGLLHIDLKREIPEAMKPRKIAIGAAAAKQIEGEAVSKS